jgi:hypothetical protein
MSSVASSPCRIELGARVPLAIALLTLALLAAAALAMSGVAALPAALAWIAVVAIASFEWHRRRRRPQAMVLHPPDAIELLWQGHEPVQATLVGMRRLGPLLMLDIDAGERLRLDCWLPGLPLNAGRQLARQLARMRPDSGHSV